MLLCQISSCIDQTTNTHQHEAHRPNCSSNLVSHAECMTTAYQAHARPMPGPCNDNAPALQHRTLSSHPHTHRIPAALVRPAILLLPPVMPAPTAAPAAPFALTPITAPLAPPLSCLISHRLRPPLLCCQGPGATITAILAAPSTVPQPPPAVLLLPAAAALPRRRRQDNVRFLRAAGAAGRGVRPIPAVLPAALPTAVFAAVAPA
jgi:hypothetical protein